MKCHVTRSISHETVITLLYITAFSKLQPWKNAALHQTYRILQTNTAHHLFLQSPDDTYFNPIKKIFCWSHTIFLSISLYDQPCMILHLIIASSFYLVDWFVLDSQTRSYILFLWRVSIYSYVATIHKAYRRFIESSKNVMYNVIYPNG